jgi:GNAT superfamily N-acetyltransferase
MSLPGSLSLVEKLAAHHQVAKFDCGKNSLDLFLRRHALKNQLAEISQTYIVHREHLVVGYFTLVFGSIKLEEAPASIVENLPATYPIPTMILARWAVDKKEQGNGIGKALLKEAMLKTVAAADIAGLRAILVDAIDDKMAAYYRELGFIECPVGPRKLMMPIQHVRASLAP